MDGDKTFDLKDLTDDFWKKVVFFEITHSSGLGGLGALWLVTEDKKKYYLGFEDLPFSEYDLAENLHFMFTQTDEIENGHFRYAIEDDGWHYIHGILFHSSDAFVRDDIYEEFFKVALDEEVVKEKVHFGYYNLPDIVGLALGTDYLERIDYIRSVRAKEKEAQLIKEFNDEYERNEFLPEHLVWKPMHTNNIKENSAYGEHALIISRKEDQLVAQKFTIVFQYPISKPMGIEPSKGPEYYILFEKYYYNFTVQLIILLTKTNV